MTNFITKQKLLVFLLIIVGVLVIIQVTLSLINPHQTANIPVPAPFPTPVFAPLPKDLTNTVITTTPDQTDNISIIATISATFPRAIRDSEKPSVTLSLSPVTEGSLTWSSDSRTVAFVPNKALSTSQLYTATLIYFGKRLSWSFTTVSPDNLSQQEKNQLQIQSDINWGEWQRNLYQQYPWYDLLPIQSNSYFVYFDIDTKKFIAELYVDSTDPIVNDLKKEILSHFNSLGIPTNKYPIVWNYNPNSGSE